MAFEYTPPASGPSNVAHANLLEAHKFKPNTRHADYCAMREIPPSLRAGQKCTCSQSSTAKALKSLRCNGHLVEPPPFPPGPNTAQHALVKKVLHRDSQMTTIYHCRCGQVYLPGTREHARRQHRAHLEQVSV